MEAGVAAALAGYAGCIFFASYFRARHSRNWPSSPAKILDGSLRAYSGGRDGSTIWFAKLRYSFEAEGAFFGGEFES